MEKKVSVLSGGERTRLVLAQIAINPSNVLVLDEPTNHLDIPTKEHLKKALSAYDGTVIVVSHDREFMAGWCNKVIELEKGGSREYPGDIDDFLAEKMKADLDSYAMVDAPKKTAAVKETKEKKKTEAPKNNFKKQQTEKEIEKLEAEMAVLTEKLNSVKPGAEMDEVLAKFAKADAKLNQLMEAWAEM